GMTSAEYYIPLHSGNYSLVEDLIHNTQSYFDKEAKPKKHWANDTIKILDYVKLLIKNEFAKKMETGKMNDKQREALSSGVDELASEIVSDLEKMFRIYASKKLKTTVKHGILDA